MEPWVITILSIFGSVAASSGFWAWLQKKHDAKDVKTKMLLGIAHDRLVFLTLSYIDRGNITKEEFENIYNYLYSPYKELGGNGTVTRLMNEVEKLPIYGSIHTGFNRREDDK